MDQRLRGVNVHDDPYDPTLDHFYIQVVEHAANGGVHKYIRPTSVAALGIPFRKWESVVAERYPTLPDQYIVARVEIEPLTEKPDNGPAPPAARADADRNVRSIEWFNSPKPPTQVGIHAEADQ